MPSLKNDVLSTASSYARYIRGMEELTGFRMKKILTLPSLADIFFNSIRKQNDEAIYTYNDEYMRYFVRQSNKRGRRAALNQCHKSFISDNVFNIISHELNIKGKGIHMWNHR